MASSKDQTKLTKELDANWIWCPHWVDSSQENTAARIVRFYRHFELEATPAQATLHCSADTRYKLTVNGARVSIGPARSSPSIWYYDSLDIAPHLVTGANDVCFEVIRYFSASRHGMPFERTPFPGLTVVGCIDNGRQTVSLNSQDGWYAKVDYSTLFPTGRVDDVFLHINEHIVPTPESQAVKPVPYHVKTLNGELSPWPLQPRAIPTPEQTSVRVKDVRRCESATPLRHWEDWFQGQRPLELMPGSRHVLEVQAEVHSTAFLQWGFQAAEDSEITLKVTYSEGYEHEPRSYPFFRTKSDRLDADNGKIIGPSDELTLMLPAGKIITYEPFWFRTFRVMRWDIKVGSNMVELISFDTTQTNYPLDVKACWIESGSPHSEDMWDVSIRTMRNCMFDGYSDCPFYEQLQYSGDSRSVGLFHYLISGDDRLMKQCISTFAASVTPCGLTQSRFPSRVRQVIAGFSLYWILQVCDHHLYFADTAYARSFLPRIDGVLDYFASHVDERGLVSGLPDDVWQFVDWVTTWGATDEHPDKGVPTAGRQSNCHTFFSMLYALVLVQAARLTRDVGRPAYACEYEARAASMVAAVRSNCYDGRFFTDSTTDVSDKDAYSQHCQVFAVLCGAADAHDRTRLLRESFSDPRFSKCSYVMMFYALRAFSESDDDLYESEWATVWKPWHNMLAKNLTTWEEDDVRQRSDCHAWGSVPIYEFCVEAAGLHVLEPGCRKVLFRPRLSLCSNLEATVCLGQDNVATVSWHAQEGGTKCVKLRLMKASHIISKTTQQTETDHGLVDSLDLVA